MNKNNTNHDSFLPRNQRYLTPKQAAEIIGVKCSILANWRDLGKGPIYTKLGSGKRSLVRYPLLGAQGLIHYMESRTQTSTSDTQDKKDTGKQIELQIIMRKQKIKLTKKSINEAKTTGKRYYIWDTEIPGFALIVQKTGYKSYFLDYKNSAGIPRRLKIAIVGEITPDEARKKAVNLKLQISNGIDPFANKTKNQPSSK